MRIALLLLARLGSLLRAVCPLLAGVATLLLCCWLSGCVSPETGTVAELDRPGEVVAEVAPGEVLRAVAYNERDVLRYVRASAGVRYPGDVRVRCPESLSLLLLATGAGVDGEPLAGSPLEAGVSRSGQRCPSVLYPVPAGTGVALSVEGLAGREQPGRDVVLSVEYLGAGLD